MALAGWETRLRVEERADESKDREFDSEYGWSERRAQATTFGSRPSDVKMGFEGRVKEGGRSDDDKAGRRQGGKGGGRPAAGASPPGGVGDAARGTHTSATTAS